MDRLVRARVLLAEAASLGITLDDLSAAASESPQATADVPTVAEYVKTVGQALGKRTAETYRSYWRLLVDRYGDRPIDGITLQNCELVIADAIARAERNRPGCNSRSTRAHCVSALHALFNRAAKAGHGVGNPAAALDKPAQATSRRRALDDTELNELVEAVQTTSLDPELDLLLVRFHLESGARRQGAIGLRLGDLDPRRSTAWLREKFGKEREQPVSPSLLAALVVFAQCRGSTAEADPVFVNKRGGPLTRKHCNNLFDRAQAALPWTRRTPATAHVLRHRAGTAVERVAGHAVTQGFLGHEPSSVTGTYTKARSTRPQRRWQSSPASPIRSPLRDHERDCGSNGVRGLI